MSGESAARLDPSGPYPGPLLGAGRTAEVFAWGDGQVLKLYRPGLPQLWVDQEARVGRIVANAGLAAPAVGDLVEVDGRPGVVYERLDGPSLLDYMATHPADIPALARRFAALHAQMHNCLRSELPSQRAALQKAIHVAPPLPAPLKLAVLERLDRLPDGQAVCHGDYHPGNLVVAQRGLVVIDWMTAGRGHPVADVAATTLLFRIARVPDYYSTETQEAVDQARRAFYQAYRAAYLGYRPFPVAEIEAWIPVLAAARLSNGIAEEEQDLLALVEAG
jgi:uncharacterized protein (TIGR02172 family)